MSRQPRKPIKWVGSAKRDLDAMPEDVKDVFAHAIAYRAVYTVKSSGWVYVLHCFQKKSKSGIKTPKEDMDLIYTRLTAAKLDFEAWQKGQGAS